MVSPQSQGVEPPRSPAKEILTNAKNNNREFKLDKFLTLLTPKGL
ncbi:MAG: hypothetical protein QXK21_01035 [Candidatus Micrarchaeia archaeon]